MLRTILTRLKEPSSLAGLSMLAMLFGVKPDVAESVMGALGAVLAAAAVLMPEHKAPLLIVKGQG